MLETVRYKKWVWSNEGMATCGDRWMRKQIVVTAVVESTPEKADEFAPGTGMIRECTCTTTDPRCCFECALMYAASPRLV